MNATTTQDHSPHSTQESGLCEEPAYDPMSIGFTGQDSDNFFLHQNKTKSLETLPVKKKKKKKRSKLDRSIEFIYAPSGGKKAASPAQRKLLKSSSAEFLQDIKQAALRREGELLATYTAHEVCPTLATAKNFTESSITDSQDYVRV